jgi:hypothetical protein
MSIQGEHRANFAQVRASTKRRGGDAAQLELPAINLGEYMPGITSKSISGNNHSHRFIIWEPPTCRGMEFKVLPSQTGTELESVPLGGYCSVLIQNDGVLVNKSEKISVNPDEFGFALSLLK